MSTPETHSAARQSALIACDTCGTVFAVRRAWTRFCGSQCRNAYHAAERRLEAIREAGPRLYAVLAQLAEVEGPVGTQARNAIAGLKPPVAPKALLEKAKA